MEKKDEIKEFTEFIITDLGDKNYENHEVIVFDCFSFYLHQKYSPYMSIFYKIINNELYWSFNKEQNYKYCSNSETFIKRWTRWKRKMKLKKL